MPDEFATPALLRHLLHEYGEFPDRREQIAKEIYSRFQQPLAILVLDSSGFTRTTQLRGIVHFMALLERLQRLIEPTILRHGGRLLRVEADNVYAAFPDPSSAVECAVEIQRDVQAANEVLPEADELYVSIGVGYGDVLVVGTHDLYGDAMNLTCKLAEDLAQRGEILITTSVHAAIDPAKYELEELHFSISGVSLTAYRLRL